MRALSTGIHHASCVEFDGQGLLILGASGSGKSTLAIACLGLGAVLIGDDYVRLEVDQDQIIAKRPPNIEGLIEVPKVGILRCDFKESTKLALAIDLSETETKRLPPRRHIRLQNCEIPLIYGADIPYLHFIAKQFLQTGFADV